MVVIYSLVAAFAFTVSNIYFRLAAKDEKNLSVLSAGYCLVAGMMTLLLIPFNGELVNFSDNNLIWIIPAILGWTLFGYLIIWINNKMEASVNALLSQSTSIFTFFIGIVFLSSDVSFLKIVGIGLIVLGNVLLFVGKSHIKVDRVFWLRLFLSFTLGFTYLFDNLASKGFNLGFYAFITYTIPALLIFLFTRSKLQDLFDLYKRKFFKVSMLSLSGLIGYYAMIKAYEFGDISTIIPISYASTVLTVIAGGIFLGEKQSLLKKILLAIVVFAGVVVLSLT